LNENFRKSLYAYFLHIYSIKSPLASITASIRGQNLWQRRMTISFSILVITSEILVVQCVMRLFIDLSVNFAPHEIIEGLQSWELGGQISLDQWSFMVVFSQSWVILALFWVARPQNPLSL
jgi:hypothetical protein